MKAQLTLTSQSMIAVSDEQALLAQRIVENTHRVMRKGDCPMGLSLRS